MKRGTLGASMVALAFFLGAAATRADVIHVKMEKLSFTPAEISAHVGDTIEWANMDFVVHTATARDGAWDLLIPVNSTKSVVLKTEGTVEYYCRFHPNMTGKITVTK
jgi:plastocyanin